MKAQRSALLLNQTPNQALAEILAEIGVSEIDWSDPEPPARITAGAEDQELQVGDVDEFWGRFGGPGARKTRLAFVAGRRAEVEQMIGLTFRHRMRRVHVRRPSASALQAFAGTPMIPHLVAFVPGTIGPREKLTPTGHIVRGGRGPDPDSGTMVVFDPIPMDLDEVRSAILRSDPGADFNGLFLPTVPLEDALPSYFDARHEALRAAVLEGAAAGLAVEPALLSIQQLMAEPLVRALLMEGGGLAVSGGDGGATAVELRLWSEPNGSASTYSDWVLDSGAVGGPSWSNQVSQALRSSLEGLAIVRADRRLSWNIPPTTRYEPGGPINGVWQEMEKFAGRLGESRADFVRWILDPSAPRVGGRAAHDLSVRRFLAHAARCPWSSETAMDSEAGPWRRAWINLLDGGLDRDECLARSYRRASGNAAIRFEPDAVPPRLSLSPTTSEDALVFARLSLPLGAIVRRESGLPLDHPGARLDSGLILV